MLVKGFRIFQKNINVLIFLVFAATFSFIPFNQAYSIFQQVREIEDTQIKRVNLSSFNPNLIYIASENSLFKSEDSAKTFKKVYAFTNEAIAHMFFDRYLVNTLYLATERHLYEITANKKILFTAGDDTTILSAGKLKEILYVGTNNGLYAANSGILNWKKLASFGDNTSIYYIDSQKDELLLATSNGAYLLKDEEDWERIFATRETEASDEENDEEEEQGLNTTFIKQDIFDEDKIWLGTNQGLFTSLDKGKQWKKLYIAGIDNISIQCIAQKEAEKDVFYVGSNKGFFRVEPSEKTAKQIFEGLYSSNIAWIEFSSQGETYLATSKGLFKSGEATTTHKGVPLEEILKNEPSIGEIQEVVLKYNETSPDKIKKWRNALKYRALVPTLSVDYNKTITYDSGSNDYYEGPRDWGVGLSWSIADLIWNTYEDDVDTRSRLNTELRLDILDEINRVYFERLRLKKELADSVLSDEGLFKRQLRLDELTAILDGYTGGYFSRRLKELNGQ